MRAALLHRLFALLLISGLAAGPVVHAAFAADHCVHDVVAQQVPDHHPSSESPDALDFGDCDDHNQLCSGCLPWAIEAAHGTAPSSPEPLAATLAAWVEDIAPNDLASTANPARGPPSPLI